MNRMKYWIGLALIGLTTAAQAQTPTVELDHHAYLPGEAIVATFSGGPANPKDWIGVYPEAVTPGSQSSTIWRYVDGGTAGNAGLSAGSVSWPNGLGFAGPWTAFLLLNDGYDVLAQTTFTVVESTSPVVRRDKKSYAPGEAIALTFTNGPANTKDWVAVYPEGVTPGSQPSTIWRYVDGTSAGNTGVSSGTIPFATGLSTVGRYVAYLLSNDGYDILASEPLLVTAPVNAAPRLIGSDPVDGSTNGTPVVSFAATVLAGSGSVNADGVQLQFDGVPVTPTVEVQDDRSIIRYTGTALLPVGSPHVLRLVAGNTAGLKITNEIRYSVGSYSNLVLPTPIYLETFDSVAEGGLPAGWTGRTYSDALNEEIDFGNLDSAAYKGWTVVEASRFTGTFVTYSDPANPAAWGADYQRVLRVGGRIVANGVLVQQLATGRMLFGNSGYRNGRNQVMFLETADFNLTGKTDVHMAFNALWEQNQDSIGAVEYSIDGGANWLPVTYYLAAGDVVRLESGEIDAEATFTTEHGDVARYTDEGGTELGGTYGAFIGAPVSAALAPFIEARIDDSATDGKRIEVRRLPSADGQSRVRFRFAHAGTDSWYFGLDNLGLYSIPSTPVVAPTVAATLEAGGLRLTWPAAPGFVLEQRAEVSTGSWSPVAGVSGNSALVPVTGDRQWFRLNRP